MKITFDQCSNTYFVSLSKDGDKAPSYYALSFEELEALGETIHQLVQDEYSKDFEAFLDDGDCDGCKI